jgi:hypothetical protein
VGFPSLSQQRNPSLCRTWRTCSTPSTRTAAARLISRSSLTSSRPSCVLPLSSPQGVATQLLSICSPDPVLPSSVTHSPHWRPDAPKGPFPLFRAPPSRDLGSSETEKRRCNATAIATACTLRLPQRLLQSSPFVSPPSPPPLLD